MDQASETRAAGYPDYARQGIAEVIYSEVAPVIDNEFVTQRRDATEGVVREEFVGEEFVGPYGLEEVIYSEEWPEQEEGVEKLAFQHRGVSSEKPIGSEELFRTGNLRVGREKEVAVKPVVDVRRIRVDKLKEALPGSGQKRRAVSVGTRSASSQLMEHGRCQAERIYGAKLQRPSSAPPCRRDVIRGCQKCSRIPGRRCEACGRLASDASHTKGTTCEAAEKLANRYGQAVAKSLVGDGSQGGFEDDPITLVNVGGWQGGVVPRDLERQLTKRLSLFFRDDARQLTARKEKEAKERRRKQAQEAYSTWLDRKNDEAWFHLKAKENHQGRNGQVAVHSTSSIK